MAKIIHKKAFFFRYAQKSAKKLIVLLYLAYIGLIDWIKKGPKFHGMFPLIDKDIQMCYQIYTNTF